MIPLLPNSTTLVNLPTMMDYFLLQLGISYFLALGVVAAAFGLYSIGRKASTFPLLNGKKYFEFSNLRSRTNFILNGKELMAKGEALARGRPFRVLADVGEVTILPPEYAYEIRNHDHFAFTQAAYKWFYAHLPGMEGFREGTSENQIMKLVARHQLTHYLTLVTKPVSDEASAALEDTYTDSKEWHEIMAKDATLKIVARVSSRIFLGEELCRDADWLRITTNYTTIAFRAVEELRLWPAWLRSVVHWYLPHCTAARKLVKEAQEVIEPILQKRRQEEMTRPEGQNKRMYHDAIEWLDQLATEKGLTYDPASAQLSLSVAALHSSSDALTQVILDIASHPDIIQPLREEIIAVIGHGNWSKHSLYDLKLMDSAIKESQRLKPIAIASMRRFTTADTTLSDGVVVPGNRLTLVSAHRHWDPKVYDSPEVWDGYRFLKMRQQQGKENTAQLVSATPDHMGFGYGLHACPGRFFASEEIKIILCHILLKYDIKTVVGSGLEPRKFGFSLIASPTAKLAIRRRKEEVEI